MKPNGFLTVPEAACRLGCSPRSVYRLINAGVLHAVLPRGLSRGWLVAETELVRFATQELEAVSPTAR